MVKKRFDNKAQLAVLPLEEIIKILLAIIVAGALFYYIGVVLRNVFLPK